MIAYPNIDPVLVRLGPLAVRWYGLMYVIGFVASNILVNRQARKRKLDLSEDDSGRLFTYLILGLMLGARLGYILFYNLGHYVHEPMEIFAVWHGGMSFHGGLIGAVVGGALYAWIYKKDFWLLSDLVVVTVPIGLCAGRIGNFINGELYGRVTDLPWGMVFPYGGPVPRHPSQLYESFFEGVVLFALLWSLKERKFPYGSLTALFLVFYGLIRFSMEFFREPDAQLGFIFGPFTMGQVLSSAMVLAGAALFVHIRGKGSRPGLA